MTTELLALDRASVRTKDADGRLHVALVPLTKANVSGYLGSEIPGYRELGLKPDEVYQLYRDPEALEAAVATANNLPVLSTHVPVSAEDPHKGLIVGSTGTDAKWSAPYITNSLVVWDAKMIALIESDEQKQISAGYRYTPVMRPGEVDGKKYQGRMTAISFNHIAIVGEGRVGADVVIGDSKEILRMVDRNTAGKAKFAADALKLAQDGKFDALKDFLTAFADEPDGPAGGEEMDAEPPALGGEPEKPIAPAEKPAAGEGEEPSDPIEKVKAFLRGKLSDEDMKQLDALVAAIGEAGERHEEGEEEAPAEKPEAPEKPVTDEDPEDLNQEKQDMVTRPAMDAAIAAAVQGERKAAQELRDAERFVRPFVGELAVAFDSAEKLLRAAAKSMKIPDADKVHASALKTLIAVAGAKPARAPTALVAMDAAAKDDFAKRFPNADRLKN